MRDAGQKTEEISQDDGSEEEVSKFNLSNVALSDMLTQRQIDSGGQGSIQPLVAEFTSVSGRDGASTAHGSERISAMRPPVCRAFDPPISSLMSNLASQVFGWTQLGCEGSSLTC